MKILIIIPSFHNGGTVTSLKNLVSMLDLSKYQFDVFAITNVGPNRDFISKYCNILGDKLDETNQTLKSNIKSNIFKSVKRIKKSLERLRIDISPIAFKSVVKKLERKNYDLVIAFQEGQATRFASYFKKTRKVSWVRCDYKNMLRIAKMKPQHKLYSKIDKIVCVSEYTKNVFISFLPETSSKTIPLHNLISDKVIIEKSNDLNEMDSNFHFDGFKIVSLGRIDPVKRFSFIPEIVYNLKEKGLKFRWYIIGGGVGPEKDFLLNNISKYSVQEELLLLGEKNNPYPYIKDAELLVSTSLSEACPNVINEAKILGTPIVATDFGSVFEFINDGVNGLISPIESISDKIEQMISNEATYTRIKSNISQFKYSNDGILDVWYNEILINKEPF